MQLWNGNVQLLTESPDYIRQAASQILGALTDERATSNAVFLDCSFHQKHPRLPMLTRALDASTASNLRLHAGTAIDLGAARSCAAAGTGSAPESSS
jgi:hypothetical protein